MERVLSHFIIELGLLYYMKPPHKKTLTQPGAIHVIMQNKMFSHWDFFSEAGFLVIPQTSAHLSGILEEFSLLGTCLHYGIHTLIHVFPSVTIL